MSLIFFELRKLKENKLLLCILSFTVVFVVFLFALNRFMQIQAREDLTVDLEQRMEESSWEIQTLIMALEEERYIVSKEETEERLALAGQVHNALYQADEALRNNQNEEYLSMTLLYQEHAYDYRERGGFISFSEREFLENELLFPELIAGDYHYEDKTYATSPVHFLVIFLSWFFHPIGLSLFVIIIGIVFSSEYDNRTVRFILMENDSRKKWLGVSSLLNFLLFILVLIFAMLLALSVSRLLGVALIGNRINNLNVTIEVFIESGLVITTQEKIVQLLLLGIPLFLLLFSLFYLAVVYTKHSIQGLLVYVTTVGIAVGLTENNDLLKNRLNPFSYFDHQWVSSHDSLTLILTGIGIILVLSAVSFSLSLRRVSKKPL